jgi:hypothetical protein
VDATELLSEQQFADAIHPNAEGRELYSRFLAERLVERQRVRAVWLGQSSDNSITGSRSSQSPRTQSSHP